MIGTSRKTKSTFFTDFKKFLLKGNILELAVAVIIGASFGKIVESLVKNILTPILLQPILLATKVDELAKLSINGIQYGLFIAAVLDFLIVAFTLFTVLRIFEKAKKRIIREEQLAKEEAPTPPEIAAQKNLTVAIERLSDILDSKRVSSNSEQTVLN